MREPRSGRIEPGKLNDAICRRVIESIQGHVLFLLTREGAIASWTAEGERVLGHTAQEAIGQPFSILYPAADIANRKPIFALQVAASEGSFEEEAWRLRRDGTTFWAATTVTALKDESGMILGFAAVMKDLTRRRNEEEQLRVSEERTRLLVQNVRDYAIFMLDPEGRILSWNEGAQRLKGYAADEVIGRHFGVFYSDADRDRGYPDSELRIARKEGRYEEEGWRFRKDGTKFWANVVITALRDEKGELRGFAKVTRDLTARKLAEDETRRRALDYAALNRELESFTGAVAHDLRAPLRAMLSLTEVVLEEERHALSPSGLKSLEAVRSSATRMGVLLESLLELSRATKGELKPTTVDLSEEASRTWADLTRRDPTIKADLHVEPGLVAYADERLTHILLDNLLRNAAKFSMNAQDPRVEVGSSVVGTERAFYVRDNGVGFEDRQAADLFQPFHRLPSAVGFEGTGVGLATVRRIMTRHGGRVWAEGEPGKGATFWFTFPDAPPQA